MTPTRFPAGLLAVLLGAVTIALFWPATGHDFISYDDPLYVTANPHVQAGLTVDGLKWAFFKPEAYYGYWHPLTLVSHMLDCQMYGQKPWGHHLTGVLLHALNTMLVFVLLQMLTRATWRSVVVAALFGWHPLRVESVAWVSEHKGLLSAFFGLLSLICYVSYAQLKITNSKLKIGNAKCQMFYALALVFFACGLLCKPILVSLPFLMLLLDYWPMRRCEGRGARGEVESAKAEGAHLSPPTSDLRPFRHLVLEKIPFFFLVAVVSGVTFALSKQAGALDADSSLSWGTRVGTALISYCRYLANFFCPKGLAVFYPHPGHWPQSEVLLAAGLLVVLSALFFWQRRQHPYLWMGWLWFVVALAPVAGLMQVGSQSMADRHTYIPSLGLLIAVVWSVYDLSRRWRGLTAAMPLISSAAMVGCMVMTRVQLGYWQNSESLFRHALAVTDNNFLAHRSVGDCLYQRGQVDAAIGEYKEAIRLEPDYADAHNNLGVALGGKSKTDEAISQFQEALRLKPGYAEAHNNLGLALGQKGQIDEAVGEFIEAIRLDPDYADAHNDLGIAMIKKGQLDEAISQFQEALRLKPDYTEARDHLTRALDIKNGQPGH